MENRADLRKELEYSLTLILMRKRQTIESTCTEASSCCFILAELESEKKVFYSKSPQDSKKLSTLGYKICEQVQINIAHTKKKLEMQKKEEPSLFWYQALVSSSTGWSSSGQVWTKEQYSEEISLHLETKKGIKHLKMMLFFSCMDFSVSSNHGRTGSYRILEGWNSLVFPQACIREIDKIFSALQNNRQADQNRIMSLKTQDKRLEREISWINRDVYTHWIHWDGERRKATCTLYRFGDIWYQSK